MLSLQGKHFPAGQLEQRSILFIKSPSLADVNGCFFGDSLLRLQTGLLVTAGLGVTKSLIHSSVLCVLPVALHLTHVNRTP